MYALHAARALKVHLMRDGQWLGLEAKLRQRTLIDDQQDVTTPEPNQESIKPVQVLPNKALQQPIQKRNTKPPIKKRGGFVNNF